MTKDLTSGNPMKLILSFGTPLLFGYLFQQLYNVVDTAIVGKTLGGGALAAVGSTGSVCFLVVGFCVGICAGFSIPVAQQFGAGNSRELRRYVTGGVWLCVIFGVLLTAATVLLCRPILTAMNTPADIFQDAYLYLVTIFAGLPAYFLYNLAAGVLRALGDSRTPVIWIMIASVVNVGLDILFILAFHWGTFGAAFATVLAQGLAGVGCLIRMGHGYEVLQMERGDWRWSGRRVRNLCLMGLPMGLQYSITAIGSILIQSAVNGLGTVYVTAVAAGNKISNFICCPYDAMGATMATYGGQNVGAGKLDRLGSGTRACVLLGAVYSAAALAALYFFSDPLAMLFLDEASAGVLPMTRQYLLTQGLFFFPLALVNIVRLMIQGMGFAPLATVAGVFEMVARGALSALVPIFGFTVACFASPVAWVLADVFLIPAYFYCCRRLRRSQQLDRCL